MKLGSFVFLHVQGGSAAAVAASLLIVVYESVNDFGEPTRVVLKQGTSIDHLLDAIKNLPAVRDLQAVG